MKKICFLFTLVCMTFLAFLPGCGSSEKKPAATPVEKPVASAAQASDPSEKLKFKSADDQEVLYIKRYADHEKLEINYGGSSSIVKARKNENDRVKYKISVSDAEKELVAEVKYKEDSIKLVDGNEKLLYKIKFSDDKIKIADNEEMEKPFELKRKSEEKTEIRDRSGNEIGNVKFYPDTGKLKVKDSQEKEVLVLKNYKNSAAPGVILFEDISVNLRCIILNELLKKDK